MQGFCLIAIGTGNTEDASSIHKTSIECLSNGQVSNEFHYPCDNILLIHTLFFEILAYRVKAWTYRFFVAVIRECVKHANPIFGLDLIHENLNNSGEKAIICCFAASDDKEAMAERSNIPRMVGKFESKFWPEKKGIKQGLQQNNK